MGAENAPTDPFIPLPGNREITHRQQIGKLGPSGKRVAFARWSNGCGIHSTQGHTKPR